MTCCDQCGKRLKPGSPIFLTSSFLTDRSPEDLQGSKGTDLVYYSFCGIYQYVLCWNWKCIESLVKELSPTSRTDNWFIHFSNCESNQLVIGGFITYKTEWIRVSEAKRMIRLIKVLKAMMTINRFIYKWNQQRKMKYWLLTWSITPSSWETQDILSKYSSYTRTKPLRIRRVSSDPALKSIDDHSDIDTHRAIEISQRP
jgi:hypothetical protein